MMPPLLLSITSYDRQPPASNQAINALLADANQNYVLSFEGTFGGRPECGDIIGPQQSGGCSWSGGLWRSGTPGCNFCTLGCCGGCGYPGVPIECTSGGPLITSACNTGYSAQASVIDYSIDLNGILTVSRIWVSGGAGYTRCSTTGTCTDPCSSQSTSWNIGGGMYVTVSKSYGPFSDPAVYCMALQDSVIGSYSILGPSNWVVGLTVS